MKWKVLIIVLTIVLAATVLVTLPAMAQRKVGVFVSLNSDTPVGKIEEGERVILLRFDLAAEAEVQLKSLDIVIQGYNPMVSAVYLTKASDILANASNPYTDRVNIELPSPGLRIAAGTTIALDVRGDVEGGGDLMIRVEDIEVIGLTGVVRVDGYPIVGSRLKIVQTRDRVFDFNFTVKVKPVTVEVVKGPEGEIPSTGTFTMEFAVRNHTRELHEVYYKFSCGEPSLSGAVMIDYDDAGPMTPTSYQWGTKVPIRVGAIPGDITQRLWVSLGPSNYPLPNQPGNLMCRLEVIRWLGARG